MTYEEWGKATVSKDALLMYMDWTADKEAAEKRVKELDLALQSLTPGGSEFVNDPRRCVQFVKDARSAELSMIKEKVKRVRELEALMRELREALEKYGKRGHYYCDDSWYSCPKAEEGCANGDAGEECNCGADKVNAEVDTILWRRSHER